MIVSLLIPFKIPMAYKEFDYSRTSENDEDFPYPKLDDLMKERGWSDYRLAQNSKLSSSTIANIRSRNTVPSVVTLESICNAFGITLAQFFADNQTMVHLTPEQKAMFDSWVALTPDQKNIVCNIIYEFKKD